MALKIWEICNFHERPRVGMNGNMMPLKSSEISTVCKIYDASFQDFEKILDIERVAFPLLQDVEKINQEKNSKGSK